MPTSQTNKKKNSALKTLLIVLGAGVAILGIILFLGSRSGDNQRTASTGLVTESSAGQVPAGSLGDTNSTASRSNQIVALLNSVSSIELDDSIFRNPAFTALIDINSTLPSDRNPGRQNPFLPIGQETSMQDTIPSSTSSSDNTTMTDTMFTNPVVSTGETAREDFLREDTVQ